jgi:hypothetical protein
MMRLLLLLSVWLGAVGTTASTAAETWVEATTLSGERIAGRLQSWTAERLVIDGETSSRPLPTTDLLTLRFPRHPRQLATRCVVLVNGDRFAVLPTRARDDELTASWLRAPLRPSLVIPLETVSGWMFEAPAAVADFRETLATLQRTARGVDTVRLMAGDELTGEFVQLEHGLLELRAAVGTLKLDRSRVRWVALDPELGSSPDLPATKWVAFLTDGSRITATDCRPGADFTVQLTLAVGGRVVIPWHEVARVVRLSERTALLSERTPALVDYRPYLDGRQELSTDRSVRGSPLLIRGEEFADGLGLRSRTAVTYDLEPGDRWFESVVGIDDAADGAGSARFRVELDGEIVWTSAELTGRSPPVSVPRIDLQDRRRLTLVVDFGERGDVGDLADWCEPLVIRAP